MPDSHAAELNLRWARALIGALAGAGVRHAVISPGSRSTPLALACADLLETHVIVDERSAAYFALGMARADGVPVVLVCTSGTALGNWMPAVVEANLARVPLLLLSADRPREILGFGANQTMDQYALFGTQVRGFHGLPEPDEGALPSLPAIALRALEQSLWPMPGPVHVNVPFREPLVPARAVIEASASGHTATHARVTALAVPTLEPYAEQVREIAARMHGGRGVIVCGAGRLSREDRDALLALAGHLDAPMFADPLSGLRRGAHDHDQVLCGYDAFLRHPRAFAMRPDWLLRFGAMPVSKRLGEWLGVASPALHIVVEPHGGWPDPLQSLTHMVRAEPGALCRALHAHRPAPAPADWSAAWRGWERRVVDALRAMFRSEAALPPEAWVVDELARALPDGATLFSGNSMAIRELDSFLGADVRGLRVLANRGASGIDGNVSTLAGLAANLAVPVAGLIGDLALHHDLNGLHALRGHDVVLVVLNNGGGAIFGYLPQSGLEDFERLWRTPVATDFAHAARAFGIGHARVETRASFVSALRVARAQGGPHLIEVTIDAASSRARHVAWWDSVARDA